MIKINTKELIQSLKVHSKFIDTKGINPSLSGILLKMKSNKIIVISSDSMVSCQTIIEHDSFLEEEKDFLVKGTFFYNIVNKINSDEIKISYLEGNKFSVDAKNYSSEINSMESELFPHIDFSYEEMKKYKIKNEIINDITHNITKTSLRDPNKIDVLNGVNLISKNRRLRATCTDSFKLLTNEYENDIEDINLNINSKTLEDIVSLINENEDLEFYTDERKISWKINKTIIQTKLIDGIYPDTSRIINSPQERFIKVKKNDIVDALQRGLVMVSSDKVPIVKLGIEEETLSIYFKNNGIGNSYEKMQIENPSDIRIEIAFNSNYLLTILSAFKEEEVLIMINGEYKPIILKQENTPNLIGLVAPIPIS
jgi:DNA polymerase III subunit beta